MIRYSRQLISSSDIKTVNQVLKSDFLIKDQNQSYLRRN